MTETRLHYDKDLIAASPQGAASEVMVEFEDDYHDTPLEVVTINVIKLDAERCRVKIRAETNPDYPEG